MEKTLSYIELEELLDKINRKKYGAYKRLLNKTILYRDFKAKFTKIQPDPYAKPSIIECSIPHYLHRLDIRKEYSERIPLTDYIYRKLYNTLRSFHRKCGSGYSCYLGIPRPSPAILLRSAVEIKNTNIVVRFYIGLPSEKRRINSEKAKVLLLKTLPNIIRKLTDFSKEHDEIREHINIYKDYMFIRAWLETRQAIAFIKENSILPRESSISDKPLANAIPFTPPKKDLVDILLPGNRKVRGLLIRKGLTLIIGGAYHGKSTLLQAIQQGIYPHIKGDGREYVVTIPSAIAIQAEDGRFIHNVDISSFIDKLPMNIDTKCFTTKDASGSTSMAASVNEAVEIGCKAIIIDEDNSSTNFLFKDHVMQKILKNDPIKPLSQQIRDFIEKTGTSIILVMSSSSIFLDKADTIILMENYKPRVIDSFRTSHEELIETQYSKPLLRKFLGIKGLVKIKQRGKKLFFKYRDKHVFELDLGYNPRIIEEGQVKTIKYIITWLINQRRPKSCKEVIKEIDNMLINKGFKAIANPVPPDLAWVSGIDVVWVLNRIDNAMFKQITIQQ